MERSQMSTGFLVLAAVLYSAEANSGTILADGSMACERMCDRYCQNGFLSDTCPRCTCAPDPCEFRNCPPGTTCRKIETDCGFSRGCPMTAVCESRASPVCQSTCNKQCDYGFEAVGCPRCTCAENPCLSASCPNGTQCMTKPTSCKFKTFCPHFAMCMSQPCAAVTTTECRFGLLPIGCPRSRCAADPCLSTKCADGRACRAVPSNCAFGVECPYVGICEQTLCAETVNKVCTFGFLMRGCPRSECAPDPCLTKTCPDGETCFLQNGTCPFAENCPLEAVCQPSACEATLKINCPYGFKSQGCPRSECAEDPCASSPCGNDEECFAKHVDCPFTTGCPYVADCRPKVCQEVLPNLRCEYGFQLSGCPRNLCAPNPCDDVVCPSGQKCFAFLGGCEFGIECPYVHQCQPTDCSDVQAVGCAYGVEEVGCPRSICAADPCLTANCTSDQVCTTRPSNCRSGTNCPHEAVCSQDACSDVAPNVQCTFGFESVGCPRVQCAPNPCDGVTCPEGQSCFAEPAECPMGSYCPYNYQCREDNCGQVQPNIRCEFGFQLTGCPRDKCAPNPCDGATCPSGQTCFAEPGECSYGIECPYVRRCVSNVCADVLPIVCKFGILETGCPRNKCAPDPCSTQVCGSGRVCRTEPSQCRFRNSCPHIAVCVERDCADVAVTTCRFGVLETGCPRTTCAPDPCATRICSQGTSCSSRPSQCRFGTNCPHEAVCAASVCEEVVDNVQCGFGFVSVGCPRFQCAPNPCIGVVCSPGESCIAEPGTCSLGTNCPYRYKCQPNDCKEVIPNLKCAFGVLPTGCPRNTCAPNPCEVGFPCPPRQSCFAERGTCPQGIDCPYVRKCVDNDCAETLKISCKYGILETGCPRSKCAPDPCLNRECGSGRRCTTRPSECRFGNDCPHEAVCVAKDCADTIAITCQFGILERGCPRDTCASDPCRTRVCPQGTVCTTKPSQCRSENNCPHEAVCSESVCREVADNVQCAFGVLAVGCPRSQCAPNPCIGVTCPDGENCVAVATECALVVQCPYQYECRQSNCAEVVPNVQCDFGFLTTGCPRQTCAPNPCDGPPCPTGQRCVAEPGVCIFGNHCPFVRKCVPLNCAEVLPLACAYGVLETGCPRSTCAPNPCLTKVCGAGSACTTRPSACGFGNDCPHEAVCAALDCGRVSNVTCPFGMMETGCPRSTCAPDPCLNYNCGQGLRCTSQPSQCRYGIRCPHEAVCVETNCALVSSVSCTFGVLETGCPRSTCAPNPCLVRNCGPGKKCTTRPSQCRYRTSCPHEAVCTDANCREVAANVQCAYGVLLTGCPRATCAPNPCDGSPCPANQTCVVEPGECAYEIQCPYVRRCTPRVCGEVLPLSCPFGVALSGCPRNKCAPNPCDARICGVGKRCVSKPATCQYEIECPYVAECVDNDCAEALQISCPFGFLETGCPRNTCAPDPCESRTCATGKTCTTRPSTCRFGNACPHEAVCSDSVCREVAPNVQCAFGFQSVGCPRASCAPNPCDGVSCPSGETCVAVPGECPLITNCPYRYRCQQANCRDLLPNVNCDFGFLLAGCPRDTCAPNPCDDFSCPVGKTCFARPGSCTFGLECPYVPECLDNACEDTINAFCPFGFVSVGCPRRTCALDPCLNTTCSTGQTCYAKPGSCRFQTNCPYEAECRTGVCEETLPLSCDFGFKGVGCPRRECAEDPCRFQTCPTGQTCFATPGTCEFSTNCPYTAQCRDEVCEQTLPLFCEFGFKSVGCPRRQCADNPCSPNTCPAGEVCYARPGTCQFEENCPYVADCRPRVCEETLPIFCEFGFKSAGCPRGECADNPCRTRTCPNGQTCFAKPGTCEFQRNCPFESECRAEVCEDTIPISCEFGFKSIGCPRRECADDPCKSRTCPRGQACFAKHKACEFRNHCPYESECRADVCEETVPMSCQFGFKNIGCPRRECADDPCDFQSCPPGRTCFAKPTECGFKENCPYEAECRSNVCEETIAVSCEFGFRSIGCPRRQCAPNPCARTVCLPGTECYAKKTSCEFQTGCPYVAECRPAVCAETMPMNCPFGFEGKGCPRHTCAPDPCLTADCRPGTKCTTQPTQCRFGIECKHEAICLETNCRDVLPNLRCRYGVELTGCPRSTCAPNPCEGNPCPDGQTCFVEPGTCAFGVECPYVRKCAASDCGDSLPISCPFGILEVGCPRSTCAPDPCLSTECAPGQTCSSRPTECSFGTFCPYEAVCLDNDCPQVLAINCQFGIEETGCPRDTCTPDPCLLANCREGQTCTTRPTQCRFGISCPHEAVCVDAVCEDVATNVQCLFGFESTGCPRVQCAPNPCTRISCPSGSSCVAEPGNCTLQTYCPYTFRCQENNCRDVLPNIICLYGVALTGCPRSECAPNPCDGTPCLPGQRCFAEPGQCDYGIQCPYVRRCVANDCAEVAQISCVFGFLEEGCPRSTCAPDPCAPSPCGSGRRCTSRPSQCRFGNNCSHEAVCGEADCPDVLPNLGCRYGVELTGCPRSTCAPNPCEGNPCLPGETCFVEPGTCAFGLECPYVRKCVSNECEETLPISCPFGILEVGCPRSTCAPDPCLSTECALGQTCSSRPSQCRYGTSCPYEAVCVDNDCPQVLAINCQFGIQETGCPRDTCAPDPCTLANCRDGQTCTTRPTQCRFEISCPHEAVCVDAVCEDVATNVQCLFGFESIGCPRVQCAPNPCTRITCPTGSSCVAEPGNCTMQTNCPYTFRCRENNCKDVLPNIICLYGVVLTGCPRTECAPNPCDGTPCPPGQRCFAEPAQCDYGIQCPYVRRCVASDCAEVAQISCPFGILEEGCPRSTCAPDPCAPSPCGSGRRCTSQSSQCRFGNNCPHEAVCVESDCRDVLPNLGCRYGVELTGCPRSTCAPNPCESNPCLPGETCFVEPGTCAFGLECPFVRKCVNDECGETLPISCPFGILEVGCPRSTCAPDPCLSTECAPGQTCSSRPSQCRYGTFCPYEAVCLDNDCAQVLAINCQFGFQETGCPRDTCAPDPCRLANCRDGQTCTTRPTQCRFGISCPHEAICVDAVCEEVATNVQCLFGFESIGCPRSQCAPNPCTSITCPTGTSCVAEPGDCTFQFQCPYTFRCRENNCRDVLPNIICLYGVALTGCPRSECAPNPCEGNPCSFDETCFAEPRQCDYGIQCPYVRRCVPNNCAEVNQISCPFGFLEEGCPRSTCAPDPCRTSDCGSGRRCTSRPSQCRLGNNCPHEATCVETDCREVLANIRCDYGFQLTGCPRSTCAPNPCDGRPCPSGQSCFAEPGQCEFGLECPYVRRCREQNCAEVAPVSCMYGVLETGCPRSTCAPNPCLSRNCGPRETCTTRPTLCRFAVSCPHEAVCIQSVCRAVAANIQCPFGFESIGCPRATCARNPCEVALCSGDQTCFAEPGNCTLGVNCPYQARCRSTNCRDVVPNISCTFGVALIGCPRRQCAPNPCIGVRCPSGEKCVTEPGQCDFAIQCPYVHKCVQKDCAEVLPVVCPFGILEEGCPRDTCAPDPCHNETCGIGRRCTTRPSLCQFGIDCPHVAVCQDAVCTEVAPNVNCPFGFLSLGCPRSQCAPNPCVNVSCGRNQQCVAEPGSCVLGTNCPFVHRCIDLVCEETVRIFCEYGFKSVGCPRQECSPDPCLTAQCRPDEECFARAGTCRFQTNCPYVAECKPRVCEDLMPISCNFGFKSLGCPRYECAEDPCRSSLCGDSFACFATNGSCEFEAGCPFQAECLPLVCEETLPINCPMGFKNIGCPRSQCAEDPCLNNNCTGNQECFLRESKCGFNTGCPMESFCGEAVCAETLKMNCPYGFEAVGCPRSVCSPDPCLTVRCRPNEVCTTTPTLCEYLTDCPHKAVCELSLCEETCSRTCPFGFQMEGCPRCECSPDPCSSTTCDTGLTCKTRPSICQFSKDCPHEAYCDDTACEATCSKQCDFGFKPMGCPRCECVPDPCVGASCPVGQACMPKVPPCEFSTGCPAVASCEDSLCAATCSEKQCQYGFEISGCPRCTCVQDPCLDHQCPSGTVCESEPGTCVMGNECPYHAVCTTEKCPQVCSFRTCPYGFLESGCPRCNCAPNPCVGFNCAAGQRCVAVEETCLSGVACPKRAACVEVPGVDRCILARDRGTCSDSISSYFFDSSLKTCKWFSYSGCGGNANRFDTWFLCMQACNRNGAQVRVRRDSNV